MYQTYILKFDTQAITVDNFKISSVIKFDTEAIILYIKFDTQAITVDNFKISVSTDEFKTET